MSLSHLLVEEESPLKTRVHPYIPQDESCLQEGQVLVHVAKLALTSNTQTYALAGKHPMLKYFAHFPAPRDAPDGHAMCPCWGVGIVKASKCTGVAKGVRVYGYYTFSPTVILTPSKLTATSFEDSAANRAGLIAAYITYFTSESPQFQGLNYVAEDFQMATGVLFSTGWAMAQTAALHPEKPTAIVLTSASSRTSQAAAFAAKFHELPLQVIGITSVGNKEFVKSIGTYDVVVSYDELGTLVNQKVAVLDVAGDAKCQEGLYQKYGIDLVYYGSVGMSHVGNAGQKAPKLKGLGGAKPDFFLVFMGLEAAAKSYGREKYNKLLQNATKAWQDAMMPKFHPVRSFGVKEVQTVWEQMAANKTKPEFTYIVSMWPESEHDLVFATSKL